MIRYSSKSNNQNKTFLIPVIVSLTLILGLLIGRYLGSGPLIVSSEKDTWQHASSIQELMHLIKQRYVDPLDSEEISRKTMKALAESTDPYATYIAAEDLEFTNNQMEGYYDGIGLEFYIMDTFLIVYKVIEESPALEAGIIPGDIIVGFNGKRFSNSDYTVAEAIGEMRNTETKKAVLNIQKPGETSAKSIELQKRKLTLNPVSISMLPAPGTIYIKLEQFNGLAYKKVMAAIEELIEEDSSFNLILDLRGNQGGIMQEAVNLLSQFFKEKDRLLVYTEGKNYKRTEYKTTGKNFFEVSKLVLLIDENSASASEVMAACVQDLDRGIIIGNTSFGKGTVQEQISLKNGDAIRLTVARYYTPSGRTIHKEGVTANVLDIGDIVYKSRRGRSLQGNSGVIPDFYVYEDGASLTESSSLDSLINSLIYRYFTKNSCPTLNYIRNHGNRIKSELYADFVAAASSNTGIAIYLDSRYKQRLEDVLLFKWGLLCYGKEQFYKEAFGFDPAMILALIKMKEPDPLSIKSIKTE